jgi:RNA polymerase sigma-70 factor (ECF subfamily)
MDVRSEDTDVLRGPLDPRAEQALVNHRSRLLAFLERKTRDRDVAEDVLQAAYLRALERGTPAVGDESVVAWFKAVLQNAWLDRVRRGSVEVRAARDLAVQPEEPFADAELHDVVCACVHDAIESLKPEYAAMIQEVDLAARSLGEVARESGITANNAGVRLHRARQVLGQRLGKLCGACAAHGCLECSCKGTSVTKAITT